MLAEPLIENASAASPASSPGQRSVAVLPNVCAAGPSSLPLPRSNADWPKVIEDGPAMLPWLPLAKGSIIPYTSAYPVGDESFMLLA
jgi:hypothetical protein